MKNERGQLFWREEILAQIVHHSSLLSSTLSGILLWYKDSIATTSTALYNAQNATFDIILFFPGF